MLAGAALACRDAERVRFGYTAASGERTRRHVEPHRLVTLDRRWYLVAYDLDRQDWRIFRLDRIAVPPGAAAPVTPTGARFRHREIPGGDAAGFVRRTITTSPAEQEVIAVVAADAGSVEGKVGRWASVRALGPGRCEVRMGPPDNPDWPVVALGMLGADFQVLSAPPGLADRVRDWGSRFTRAVGGERRAGNDSGGRWMLERAASIQA